MARLINRNNGLIFIAVLLLALISLWLRGQIRDPAPSVVDVGAVPHIPDFTIENFAVVAMDANGAPRQRMVAAQLLHYADDQTATVNRPRVIIYNAETPPWTIDAARGWLSADGNTLRLTGEVIALRERDEVNEGIKINTRDVDIDLLNDVATTDKEVLIVADSGVTESVGMRARFAENRFFLKDRVRGRYAIPSS